MAKHISELTRNKEVISKYSKNKQRRTSDLSIFSFTKGYPVIVNRTREVNGSVVVVKWKPCIGSLFTIYHREVFSENDKGPWSGVNVSGHETRYDFYNLFCHKKYEIAMTAWNSSAETPLKTLNRKKMWRVTTLGGNGNVE